MYRLAEDGKRGLVSDGGCGIPAGDGGVQAGSAALPGVADGDFVFLALWAVSSQVVRLGWEECVHLRCWPDPRGVCSEAEVLPGLPRPLRTPDWQAPSVRWSGAFFLETYLV